VSTPHHCDCLVTDKGSISSDSFLSQCLSIPRSPSLYRKTMHMDFVQQLSRTRHTAELTLGCCLRWIAPIAHGTHSRIMDILVSAYRWSGLDQGRLRSMLVEGSPLSEGGGDYLDLAFSDLLQIYRRGSFRSSSTLVEAFASLP